jgi:putative iron-dependent peroxidase
VQAAGPQPILISPTPAATFLVVTVSPGSEAEVRDVLADVGGLRRSVGFRAPEGRLTCVVGIGSAVWNGLSDRRARRVCYHE